MCRRLAPSLGVLAVVGAAAWLGAPLLSGQGAQAPTAATGTEASTPGGR